ncbi:sensor histidine kinase [Flammeovirga kamogawensis]|uniref:Oxygen sensor histidine kinase NreB n=1 Tax=Flammeovirga kamogawensis TaxID=373891 RepID=A0ABX8GUW7_9BACT|nr:ATP-binding protein [Flammeovirga kamogawensis]MBB6461682.1 PAS domain S-box-containing protein [Flammeovirga kamogawensis]QWG07393.1 type IV pili methyl-accepting chemotaxis transducer N-terminal domain-containing protein [Flammeovirga kamogawensis]TRX69206.1 PAS domain S-box protein [Flammeovirga kamogawensis]
MSKQTVPFTLANRIENLSFNKLWNLYFTAITVIILLLSVSQAIFYSFSQKQSIDANIINKAGKQRMLSQKITKCVLLIEQGKTSPYLNELRTSIFEWKTVHKELGQHNKQIDNIVYQQKAIQLYDKMNTFHVNIIDNIDLFFNDRTIKTSNTILANEEYYLINMDKLVNVYSEDANKKLDDLQNTSLLLFLITLIILFLELAYVFRPTARRTKKTIDELEKAKILNQEKINEVDQLYRSLGQSYQFLSETKDNEELLNVTLAKTDTEGNFISVSEHFIEILKLDKNQLPKSIFEWLIKEDYKEEMIQEILESILQEDTWVGTLQVTDAEGDYIWIETTISLLHTYKPQIIILGRDITEQKEAEERSKELNQEEIDKHIESQKSRSLLILKGQEEERGRISKDIHDGIGQLLTALKFSLESIDSSHIKNATGKLKESNKLLKKIIREVRRVSFNLSPNTLGDYGINAVLTRFANETSRLSDVQVNFDNKSDFNQRFEKHIETNIYRIVQEAVNNAIKYSEAEVVHISLNHDFEIMEIIINDNGKGFDMENLQIKGGGNGLLNMKERAGFVGGTIDVRSSLGKGTTISVEVPINKEN